MTADVDIGFTVISGDDHVVEPRHLFEGRMPAARAERAPRAVCHRNAAARFRHPLPPDPRPAG